MEERVTVLLFHTGHHVEHLEPVVNRREHCARRNVTRKTRNVPLPLSTTSAGTKERTRESEASASFSSSSSSSSPSFSSRKPQAGVSTQSGARSDARKRDDPKHSAPRTSRTGPPPLHQGLLVVLHLRRLVRSIQVLISRPRP